MKMYKLCLSISLVEEPQSHDSSGDGSASDRSVDPVKRHEEFNDKVLDFMEKAIVRRDVPPYPSLPASRATISQTYDMPVQSFEDALGIVKKLSDLCATVATPSESGVPTGFYAAG